MMYQNHTFIYLLKIFQMLTTIRVKHISLLSDNFMFYLKVLLQNRFFNQVILTMIKLHQINVLDLTLIKFNSPIFTFVLCVE